MSPTVEPLSRQPTSWRTIILKKFLHYCKSSRTHNRFPNLGIWQKDWEPLGDLTLEASGIWLQNFHRTGETDSWRAQTKLCVHQDPGERSSDLTRDWARLVCACQGVSDRGVGNSGLPQGQGHWIQQSGSHLASWHFEGGHHHHHYPYQSWACKEGTQPHPSTENQIKDLLGTAPLVRARPDSPTASPSHQEACINLLSFSIRGQTEWKPQSQKTKQTGHTDHSLV